MKKKTTKIMLNDGWAFSEQKMLTKLEEYAKEGWILEKATILKFYLKKGEPQNLQYAMDFQPKVEDLEEYKKIFESAGWQYVCDCYGFYIFKADHGTKRIHTDLTLIDEWRNKEKRKSIRLILISLIGIIIFYCLGRIFSPVPIVSVLCFIIYVLMGCLFAVSVMLTYGWIFRKGK